MDKALKRISQSMRRLAIDEVLRERNREAIDALDTVIQRSDAVDEVTVDAVSRAISSLQSLDNELATISAAMGHKRELNVDLWASLERFKQVGTLTGNLVAYLQADDEFMARHLEMVDEPVLRKCWDSLDADTKAKLMRVLG